jgi:Spy/CpxP family protein refolding chaperone
VFFATFAFMADALPAPAAEGPAAVQPRFTDGRQQRVSFARLHEGPAHRDRFVAYAQNAARSNPPAAHKEAGTSENLPSA